MGTSISPLIDVTTASLGVLPGPATNLTISSVAANSVTVNWTAPTTGSPPFEFQVQQQLAVGGTGFVNVGTITVGTSQQIFGLVANTNYQFQVITLNGTGDTSSATALATTAALAPAAVTNLALSGLPGPTTVNLTWVAPATGSAPFTYQVFQASPSGSGVFTLIGPVVSGTSETITGLIQGASYDFFVQASNSAGSGAQSATLTNVQTATGAVAPSAPLNLASTAITSTSIALSWSPPAVGTPPLSYVVQYRLTP